MRRRGVIHGACKMTLRGHHLKRSLILQHVRLRHGRGACRRKERRVVNEKLEAKERNNAAGWTVEGLGGGLDGGEIKLTGTIYNLIRRLQRGRLVGWVHEAVAVVIIF